MWHIWRRCFKENDTSLLLTHSLSPLSLHGFLVSLQDPSQLLLYHSVWPTPSPQLPKTSVTHTSWCRRVRHSLCLSLQVPSLFNTKSTAADNHQTSLSAQQWNWLLDRCRKRLFTWLWSSFYEPQTNQFDLYLSVRKQTQMEHIAWIRTTTTSTRIKKLLRFLWKQPEILTVYLKV